MQKRTLAEWFAHAVILWLAFFVLSPHLGVYEDDYVYIVSGISFSGYQDLLHNHWLAWETFEQGRPFINILPRTATYLIFPLGGLRGMYVMSYLIMLTNHLLGYALFQRLTQNTFFATVAAFTMSLYAADTTRSFLSHGFQQQVSFMSLLLACWAYTLGWQKLCYGFIVFVLLTYETPAPVFVGFPLLVDAWNRQNYIRWAKNGGVIALLLVGMFLIRRSVGETRADSVALNGFFILQILAAMVLGPFISLSQWVMAWGRVLADFNLSILAVMVVSGGGFGWLFQRSFDPSSPPLPYRRFLAAGVLCLACGYLLSFTRFPPTVVQGRLTSVHLASTLGGTVVITLLAYGLIQKLSTRGWQKWGLWGLALYWSGLVGYGLLIQQDMALAWDYHQVVVSQVVQAAPDMTDGTLILIPYADLPQTTYIQAQSWSIPLVLENLYAFPRDWDNPPRIIYGDGKWSIIKQVNGQTVFNLNEAIYPVQDGNVILLEVVAGELHRSSAEEITVYGTTFHLKPPPAENTPLPWETRPLYDLLINR